MTQLNGLRESIKEEQVISTTCVTCRPLSTMCHLSNTPSPVMTSGWLPCVQAIPSSDHAALSLFKERQRLNFKAHFPNLTWQYEHPDAAACCADPEASHIAGLLGHGIPALHRASS